MDGFLTSAQLADKLGIKPASVYRYRVRGDLPEPDEFVGRTPLWKATSVDAWLAERPSHSWHRKVKTTPAEE